MIRPLARAAALLVAGPFLLLASSLAPQHVHAGDADHDHAVAHSHFGFHAAGARHTEEIEIEHDEPHVVWFDGGVLHEHSYRIDAPLPVSPAATGIEPSWSSIPADVPAPAHGPPKRVLQLRGPPVLLV